MAKTGVDDNPLASGLSQAVSGCEAALRASSTVGSEAGALSIIVLGASGDLAKKKTFPAVFHLYRQGLLPATTRVYGYARSKLSNEGLRSKIQPYLGAADNEGPLVAEFLRLVSYVAGPYDAPDGFQALDKVVCEFEDKEGEVDGHVAGNRMFYMALPPSVYPTVATMIRHHCMAARGWTRVVVEKPFGKNLQSAEALSSHLGELFTEQQLYRIDHYLGKELVQNLLVMRFANRVFFPLWNRDNIASVQITFKENFGTEGRGGYFDQYGMIRDIIQNHLMQVLCLVAMEKPISMNPEHIRDEKVKVLKCIEPIRMEDVVVGQYEGYTDDPTVPEGSQTPTFAMVVLRINNERWDGVPFIMKAGKAVDERKAEIRIQFRDVPGDIFKCRKQGRNELVIRLQPKEAVYMKLTLKSPGLEMSTTQSELDLSYGQRYQNIKIPEAYERLILDVIKGEPSNFVRRDELRVAWEIFTPLLQLVDAGKFNVIQYKPGSRGPKEADSLAEREGYLRFTGYVWVPPALSAM